MPPLTDEQRATIAKKDAAEAWQAVYSCLIPLILFSLACLGVFYLLDGMFTFPTNDVIQNEIASSDGVYVAVTVSRTNGTIAPDECGAERILIRRSSQKFAVDSQGHINIEPAFTDGLSYGLTVEWKGNRTLIVHTAGCYHCKTDRHESETSWNDVKIKSHRCNMGGNP